MDVTGKDVSRHLFCWFAWARFRTPRTLSFDPMLEPQANGSLHSYLCGQVSSFFFSFSLGEALFVVWKWLRWTIVCVLRRVCRYGWNWISYVLSALTAQRSNNETAKSSEISSHVHQISLRRSGRWLEALYLWPSSCFFSTFSAWANFRGCVQ